jgi:hypothetical protein
MKTLSVLLSLATLLPSASFAGLLHPGYETSTRPSGAVITDRNGGKYRISPGEGSLRHIYNAEMAAGKPTSLSWIEQEAIGVFQKDQKIAQYQSTVQYQPPSFFQGSSGAPIVVPPTVINTPGAVPRECRRKSISLFLFFDLRNEDC